MIQTTLPLLEFSGKYLYIYADIFFVKGFTRTMVCDLNRKKWFFIGNDYHDVILKFKSKKIEEVANEIGVESIDQLMSFIASFIENDFAELVDDIKHFPSMKLEFDAPSLITNAIIDIDEKRKMNFDKLSDELDRLNCKFLQIRVYSEIELCFLKDLIISFSSKDLYSIQFLLKYQNDIAVEDYLLLTEQFPMISITVHSAPFNKLYEAKLTAVMPALGFVYYIKQEITSCDACGIINREIMFVPEDIQVFIENITHNSCLNRKISVDINGDIKHCPSMKESYGNVSDVSLTDVAMKNEFQALWTINKDQITGCQDCEYRYVCSDCRAYVVDGLKSKPAKCNYDPYAGIWNV